MEFKNEHLKTRFVIPDKVTVRQQLAYLSEASNLMSSKIMEKMWFAACHLITEWECPHLPELKTPLDDISDPVVTDVIVWASLEVKKYMNGLDSVPKN